MGILNITPDSFSDGGAYIELDPAVSRAEQMLAEGASIIDVGAESTRPGAAPVSPDEQIRRAVPVIKAVRQQRPEAVISIDTRCAAVAAAALAAGAAIVNDISAMRDDTDMPELVRQTGAGVVLMHVQGSPQTMQRAPHYEDVVGEVVAFLRERAALAESCGIERPRIALDPGLGFGKTIEHNLALLRGLESLVGLGYPVVVGASRKSFIGKLLGATEMAERLPGSLACALRAAIAGAQIIRAHDVSMTLSVVSLVCPH